MVVKPREIYVENGTAGLESVEIVDAEGMKQIVKLRDEPGVSTIRIPRETPLTCAGRCDFFECGYLRLTMGCPRHEDAANEKTRTKAPFAFTAGKVRRPMKDENEKQP
jgi:hypothetical protein